MHILIENKEAVLKKGASFDYIVENRFFTGADSYSLSITFPLKGCSQNLAIFGHINRKDSSLDKLLLECEIHDRNFHAYGAVNIVEISEAEVKTQFLVGKSVQNYMWDLDDIYINNVRIGRAREDGHFSCDHYWGVPYSPYYTGYVCLPWVNNTSGNLQNKLIKRSVGWHFAGTTIEDDAALSCQYYLVYVLKKILEECDYTYDLTALEYSCYRLLVIFNTFPFAWGIDEWGLALPHWTVTELLEQVELFTNGQFTINRKLRKVTFRFNKSILEDQRIVTIDNVVEEHQVEISDKKDTNDTYSEQVNLKYADADHHMMKYYSSPWVVNTIGRVYFSTFAALKSAVNPYLVRNGAYGNVNIYNKVLYANDIDTYFVLRCYKMIKASNGKIDHYMRITPVNIFEPKVVNRSEDAQSKELSIVPVCIDHASDTIGDCVFLECGTYGDVEDADENQTLAVNTLTDGEPEKKEEYYDKLYVGYWDGTDAAQNHSGSTFYPLPWVDNILVNPDNNLCKTHMDEQEDYSMRLKGRLVAYNHQVKHKVDQSIKFTFKFLISDGVIPDINSIFYIHGRKYLAEKITATFTEDGISQLVKMVAYRLIS